MPPRVCRHRLALTILGLCCLLGASLGLRAVPAPAAPVKEEATAQPTAATAGKENWSHWRGPLQNGVSYDRDLPDNFSVVWKAPYGGRTTPIIQNGHIYFINKTGSGPSLQERVMCLDEATGNKLWEYKFNVWHTDIVEDRLGWTTMVGDPETDTVYAHGTQGLLFCFSRDGKVVWSRSLTEEFGRISGYGGRVTSPIVDGDLLLLGMLNSSWGYNAVGRNRFMALDKRTGQVVWETSTGLQPKNTYYSVPVVAVIGGQRLLISGGGDGGVHAFKVRTGEKVWSYIIGNADVNCSPVVDGDLIYIGHGETNPDTSLQGRVVCLNGAQVQEGQPKLVWKVDGIKVKFASPILHEGKLYVCNDLGRLYCLNAKDGKQLWRFNYGKNTKGSPLWADGKIYIGEVDYKFHILKPDDKGCKVLHTQSFGDAEINGSPSVANGHVYFMTANEFYCLGKRDHQASVVKIPEVPKEAPVASGEKPAVLQVFPGEVDLAPGESVQLKARAFDSKGRPLGEVKVDWSLAGVRSPEGVPPPPANAPAAPPLQAELEPKTGSATAKLTVAKTPPGQYGRVIAKLGDLTGQAAVRVVPMPPYKPDFSRVPDGRTPAGWVNTQGKFLMKTLPDGTHVLAKRNDLPSPLVAKALGYCGPPSLTNYTIEADIQPHKAGTDLPDCGVSANRYLLWMSGNNKQLRLTSWDALPRVDKSIPFTWDANVWYRFKLTVEVKGDKAVARGKVWKADQTEPPAWTVEVEDSTPNKEGAPALFGSVTGTEISVTSPGTEIFYRNVSVTPNKP
jgi:outer membrane protein assembly factor BamB